MVLVVVDEMATRCCAGDAHDFRVMCTLFSDQSAFPWKTPSLLECLWRSS